MMKLHIEGVPASEIATRLGISKWTVYSNLKRLEETVTMEGRPRSARPKTATASEVVKWIREKIRRIPRRSMRKLAQE
ncbi:unnamed protein product [Nippostrongylus brasiliensis]|uniref:HTH_11 domain-containing protein n=1 Tax=Nippostrongylus brasiliensis TaxID=27835 RepID=A0A0N4XCD3_NIPBR|nr:unnamed protein product [Nippostrongylus brasiliensis]